MFLIGKAMSHFPVTSGSRTFPRARGNACGALGWRGNTRSSAGGKCCDHCGSIHALLLFGYFQIRNWNSSIGFKRHLESWALTFYMLGWDFQVNLQLPESVGPSICTACGSLCVSSRRGHWSQTRPVPHSFGLVLEPGSRACTLGFSFNYWLVF